MRREILGPQHDSERATFTCGVEKLDRYLKQQASQDYRKRVAVPYVLLTQEGKMAGYFTLSADGIRADDLPPELLKPLKLPRYDTLPAALIGRLARNIEFRGQGLGAELLADALKLALHVSESVASVAVIVDAKDQGAEQFYNSFGFRSFPQTKNKLFLPMQTIRMSLPVTVTATGT